MDGFSGSRAIGLALTAVAGNLGVFCQIALGWTLLLAAVAIGCRGLPWLPGGAASIVPFSTPIDARWELAVTALSSTLASLSISIQWTRFILRGTRPRRWLSLPVGSARYFSRSLILAFGGILGLVPGFLVAAAVNRSLPEGFEDGAKIASIAVILANTALVLYVCARLWLVFPAIALGDARIDFGKSFRLTKPLAGGLLGATAVVFALFSGAVLLLSYLNGQLQLAGPFSDAAAIGWEVLNNLILLVETAAMAGIAALAYRSVVPLEEAAGPST